jgi:hypothetical protein
MLDNLAPIREAQADWIHRALVLEHPAPAYRLRRTLYHGEPLPPETPHAANPTTGASIYYYLGTRPRGPLTLMIRTAQGKLVRRYTSNMTFPKPPPAPFPTLWIAQQKAPTDRAGLNRFVWHLRATPPLALRRGYQGPGLYHATPITPRGPIVVPGRYLVTVEVDGHHATTSLVVLADPRVRTSHAAYLTQYHLAQALTRHLTRDTLAVHRARVLLNRLRQSESHNRKAIAKVAKTLHRLEALNGEFGYLFSIVEGADAAPTQPEITLTRLSIKRLSHAEAILRKY